MSNVAFVAVVFLALAIQGCGGSDSSPESEPSAPETPTPVVQSDTETITSLEIGNIETYVVHRDSSFIDMSPRDRRGNVLDLTVPDDKRLDPNLLFTFYAEVSDIADIEYAQLKQLDHGVFWSLYSSNSSETALDNCYNPIAKMFECFNLFDDSQVNEEQINYLPLDNWEFVIASIDGEIIKKPFKIRNTKGVEPETGSTLFAPLLPETVRPFDIATETFSLEHESDHYDIENNRFYVFPGTDIFRLDFTITDPLVSAYNVHFYDESGETFIGNLEYSYTLPSPIIDQEVSLDIDPRRDIALNFYPNSEARFSINDIGAAHVIFYNAPDRSLMFSGENLSSHTAVSGKFTLIK
jgi:hypothetical protein